MKITQITYTGFGGLGSVVFSLIGADQAREHEWSIGFIGDQPIDQSYPPRCRQQGVTYAAFQSTPGRPFKAWQMLARWLDEDKPDAIICHSINSILACRWYAWKHRIPLLAVEHTPNQVKTRNEWLASRMSMLVADRVVLLTEKYHEELRSAHGWLFRPAKIAVIPNGIDTREFFPAAHRLPPQGRLIRLGMAARFSFSKRQDLLVQTLALLVELRPDIHFELVLAGDGSELARVRQLAEASPVSERIHFSGLLGEESMAGWLRTLDIYVHATEGETLSTSILQAMATGLPIVASDAPGVGNLLTEPGQYGCCVANDGQAFATAILELLDSPACAMTIADAARQRVESHYSCQAMQLRYLAVIANLKGNK